MAQRKHAVYLPATGACGTLVVDVVSLGLTPLHLDGSRYSIRTPTIYLLFLPISQGNCILEHQHHIITPPPLASPNLFTKLELPLVIRFLTTSAIPLNQADLTLQFPPNPPFFLFINN